MESPPPPEGAQWTEAEAPVRFEDVAQDGRLQLGGMMHCLGRTGWRALMRSAFAKPLFDQGILPLLTRLVASGVGGPFGVDPDLRARGTFDLAHVPADGGGADRILLRMWLEVSAPIGVVYGPAPDRAGQVVPAGTVYAEHTLTRPFAPPGERRVTRVAAPGLEPVPGAPTVRVHPSAVVELPSGATAFEDAPSPDTSVIVFGLAHTDSNQHVNSIAYLRLFEEAALRRLSAHGITTPLLARRAHLAYVKPSFAGNRARIHLRAYDHQGGFGAVGAFVPEGDSLERATTWVHVAF